MDFKNKVAYITGGSKGIGFGVAKKLIETGMKVAISGRIKKTVGQAAQYLGEEGKVLALESDVTKLIDEVEAVKTIVDKWGTNSMWFLRMPEWAILCPWMKCLPNIGIG